MKKLISQYIILLTFLAGCSSRKVNEASSKDIPQCSVHVHDDFNEVSSLADPTDESVYNLEGNWRNQEDKIIKLRYFSGKTTIISMVYTHCQYACPMILKDMKAIERDLSSRGIEDINYVMISIDPDRDTPERLEAFFKENKLTPSWTLLTGDAENVLELAAVLGVKYKAIGNADFSHSNLITILDSNGEIVHRQEGLGVNPVETVSFISRIF